MEPDASAIASARLDEVSADLHERLVVVLVVPVDERMMAREEYWTCAPPSRSTVVAARRPAARASFLVEVSAHHIHLTR